VTWTTAHVWLVWLRDFAWDAAKFLAMFYGAAYGVGLFIGLARRQYSRIYYDGRWY